jgi:HEAT repeats
MVMQKKLTCSEFEDLAVLQAIGELDDAGSAAVAEHAGECADCAAVLRSEIELRSALAAHNEASESLDRSGFLLAQCRSELSETLDDAQAVRGHGWLAQVSPARWMEIFRRMMVFHPGWSTAALLIAGAVGGIAGRAWYRQTTFPLPGKPLMTVSAAPRVSDRQLETMSAQDIRLEPQDGAGTAPRVELRLHSEQPMLLQGTPDDAEIRRVLSYVVGHDQRFGAALRLDSLDVLRTHTSDPQVRSALCDAALRDSNPAVRLKALEVLRSFGVDPDARQAMFEALAADDNSGVRIEAVDGLQAALAEPQAGPLQQPNDRALSILRDRMLNDPNRYVRLRSASVLSQLTALEDSR